MIPFPAGGGFHPAGVGSGVGLGQGKGNDYLQQPGGVIFLYLKDIISDQVVCLHPGDTLEKAVQKFRLYKIDTMPVVDQERKLLGVFTRSNLYDALLNSAPLSITIDHYMNKKAFSLRADLPYDAIAEVVKKTAVGTAPVTDADERVVGIFKKADMVMALLGRSELLNAQLKAILNSMHNGVIAVDGNGLITMVNTGAERIFGIWKEDCLGLPLIDVFPDLNLTPALEYGKVNVGLKYRRGEITTVVNITPLMDRAKVVGAIAIFQDLTELNYVARELEAVKELNHTLDTVLNIIYDGIIVVDERGYITLCNRIFADFMDMSPEDIAGRHITKILNGSRLHVVAKTGIPETGDIQSIRGQFLIVSKLPIVKEGKVVGAVGKIIFPQLPEIKELADKLISLQNKVAYYEEELEKTKTAWAVMDGIIGESTEIKKIKMEIAKVSKSTSTVLITGESGTGKELVAKAIHMCSDRSGGPFIKINCAAISENLLEAEIFGYAPGSFTGALKNGKPGRFELADGGTIFLDEIGDMSLALQAKILRVLQEREFERVGGTKSIRVNVRILAATNKNLKKGISEGTFREDLYYRLNVIGLHLPPLREHHEDIEPLVQNFIKKYNKILSADVIDIDREALKVLYWHRWPGNVRELENAVERAVNYARSGYIKIEHLPPYIFGASDRSGSEIKNEIQKDPGNYRTKINEAERDLILAAMEQAGGNKTLAAKILNLSRSRLYVKIKKYNIL